MTRLGRGTAGAVVAVFLMALAAGCGQGGDSGAEDGTGGPQSSPASSASSASPPSASSAPNPPPQTSPPPQPSSPPASSGTAPPPPAAGRQLVAMTVTGGIAGVHNRLVVREDGTYTTTSKTGAERSGRMSPAELAELRGALKRADFARLPSTATGSPVMDGFTYRITHAGHTVTTDDTAEVPRLREVIAALPER